MKKTFKRKTMGTRVSKVVIALTLLSVFSTGLISYLIYRNDTINIQGEAARDIAVTFANTIDPGKLYPSINAVSEDDYWHLIKNQLDRIKTNLEVEYIYIISPFNDELFKYYAEGASPDEDPDDIEAFNTVEYSPDVYGEEALFSINQGVSIKTLAYDSGDYGYLVSGFAPVIDDSGEAIALVGVDLNIDSIMASSNRFIIYIALAGLFLSIFYGFVIKSQIKRLLKFTLRRIIDAYEDYNQGDLSFQARMMETHDDIDILYTHFSDIVKSLNMMLSDMKYMTDMHSQGEFDTRLDESKYSGVYLEFIKSINTMTFMYVNNFEELLGVIQNYGNGNFEANVHTYPGKMSIFNTIINELRSNLINITTEIDNLAKHAAEGKLDIKADASKYQGGWARLLEDLNALLKAVSEPLDEIEFSLAEMSKGNFTGMKGDYKGAFDSVKTALNSTEKITSSYIEEISRVLSGMSDGDLTVSITREYMGVYAPIKEALNVILSSLNKSLSEIGRAADGVLSGAEQLSQSAVELSEGSARQAESIKELNASITAINDKTRSNSQRADNANQLSLQSNQHARKSNDEMKSMVLSMESIKESSAKISSIIKIINEIAFQTNLLALNAAVEAARAGEHGKGFAVVAGEVRDLAVKSQNAAEETTSQIEDSIEKVGDGMSAADETAASLETIVNDVARITELIAQIAEMSREQAESISAINHVSGEISSVVESTADTSDKCASTSRELNSQAVILKQLVSFFKLKNV